MMACVRACVGGKWALCFGGVTATWVCPTSQFCGDGGMTPQMASLKIVRNAFLLSPPVS